MKTILVINDNSYGAVHIAEFALEMAEKMHMDILLANTCQVESKAEKVLAGGILEKGFSELYTSDILDHLTFINDNNAGFKPAIKEKDVSGMDETQVATLSNIEQVWMIIKGAAAHLPGMPEKKCLNLNTLLNKIRCPLLLIPAAWHRKQIERLVYIADLRYCRMDIVRYLAELAGPWHADISIAHLSASGLPDMEEKYALSVFTDEICGNVRYDEIFFNNIKEKNLSTAVDVMINGMHNDVLTMVNHRFHFEEILGRYVTDVLPPHISIPLLIFPY